MAKVEKTEKLEKVEKVEDDSKTKHQEKVEQKMKKKVTLSEKSPIFNENLTLIFLHKTTFQLFKNYL